MNRRILIALVLAIFLIGGIVVVTKLHQTNNTNDAKKEKTELEIKKETLLKKTDEMLKNQGIQAFIKTEASDEEIEELIEKISRVDGVNSVTLKTKDEALDEMKKRFVDNGTLLDTYTGENNIFPNSLIISVNDTNKIEKIVEKISEFENVDSIVSDNKAVDAIHKNIDTMSEEDIDLLIESIDNKVK